MEYHEPTPSILLLHDGELAGLAAVIESLGGIDRRGDPTESDRARVWDVVIASAGRMLELHEHLPETSAVRIAVLDGDGKELVTSNDPDGNNVGCPVTPDEIEHFVNMIKQSSDATEDELSAINDAIQAHNKKIDEASEARKKAASGPTTLS